MNVKKLSLMAVTALAVLLAPSLAAAQLSLVAIDQVVNAQDGTTQVGTYPTSITPDGVYVGGTAGLGFGSAGEDTGFVWDAGLGSRHIIAGGYQASVSGIGYRHPTDGSPTELVVGGDNAGYQSMNASTDYGMAGESWIKRRRTGTLYEGGTNSVSGGSTGGVIYSTFQTPNSGNPQLYVDAWGDAGWASAPDTKGTTTESNIMGVSDNGVAVGRRKDSGGVYQNYVLTFDGDGGLGASYVAGLDGTNHGELWDIADNGSWAGGTSPHATKTGLWAYVRDMSTGNVFELPTADPTASYASNSRVYGMSPDGNYAVGMDYTGGGVEKAVLWDISDADPMNWTVTDLTQLAADNGILGPFTGNLRRGIAMGVNDLGQPVVTGVGFASSLEASGWTGFVMTVPEPTSLMLLLGFSGLLLRRRR